MRCCNRAIIIANGACCSPTPRPTNLAPRAPSGRLDDVFREITTGPQAAQREVSQCITSKRIFRREFASYFATPLALVFIVFFLMLAAALRVLQFGNFYERGQADLASVLRVSSLAVSVPDSRDLAMRLWARSASPARIELLMTLARSRLWQAVIGKFLAAWAFAGVALALTFPMWITVNYLGDPDNGTILAGYIGSWLMARRLPRDRLRACPRRRAIK